MIPSYVAEDPTSTTLGIQGMSYLIISQGKIQKNVLANRGFFVCEADVPKAFKMKVGVWECC